jgi:hypothetical protein
MSCSGSDARRSALPGEGLSSSDSAAYTGAPYAAALSRYLSALEGRDFVAALHALDDAVAIEPELVEAYHRRAHLWRLLGDYFRASRDYAACVRLDPHYRGRDAIREAARQLAGAYRADPVVDEQWDPAACRNRELRAVLEARGAEAARRRSLLARPSCDLPCPSLCCYFEAEASVYGVHVAACELAALSEHLRMSGLAESDHLARVARDQAPAAVQERVGAFVPGEDGKEYLYYPRRGPAAAGITRESAPRTQACADVTWVTSRSRGCLFIRPTGCAIHDVGEPPGLAVCRGFLCLTAFVFVVARDCGFTTRSELACYSIADLHERALAVLPRMADSVCSPEASAASREMRDALAAAIDADRAGDGEATRAHLARYAAGRRAGDELEARTGQAVRETLRFQTQGRV